jgi:arylsulfatase
MHVYPPRSRAGFDDILLHEEGRRQFGIDDYEMFLSDQGYAGYAYAHGMGNNAYVTRPWPLSEFLHPTNWTARQMCRTIQRRDPGRPAFWYLSFNFPHPPLVPPQDYLAMYQHIDMDAPLQADWSRDFDRLPYALKIRIDDQNARTETQLALVKRGYYAQCTYIDHQLRLVLGTLREEGILDNTIICFVSDHGDMLGHFGLFEKRLFYEDSAKIPFILIPPGDDPRHHLTDDRLVTIEDVMPTLLDLAGIPVPSTVEGQSVLAGTRREYVYGEWGEEGGATRMLRDQRYKLIYYPVGHRFQLFDLERDPNECHDLSDEESAGPTMQRLQRELASRLYGADLRWIADGQLVGERDRAYRPRQDRGLKLQRGWRF